MQEGIKDNIRKWARIVGCYQDVVIKGEVVYKSRSCQDRWDLIEPYVTGKVLDVGSHAGYFVVKALEKGYQVVSYECDSRLGSFQKAVLNYNKLKVDLRIKYFDLDQLAQLGRFDTVLLLAVIHYFPNIKLYLKEIAKVSDKVIIEFPKLGETEALYHDLVMKLDPFDKFLRKFFGKVTLLGECESPNNIKKKRRIWLCEK